MAEQLIPFESPAICPPLCYRPLVPMLVHYSGLPTVRGFQLVNALSYFVACMLVYRLARRFHCTRFAALLAVYGFASLKFTLKFWLYVPVQVDPAATACTLGVLLAVVTRRRCLYVALLIIGVSIRENLIVLAGFHLIHERARGGTPWKSLIWLELLPLTAFLVLRITPVYPVAAGGLGLIQTVTWWAREFVATPSRQGIVFLAYCNALGALPVLAVAYARPIYEFVTSRPEWAYLGLVTVGLSIVGGADVERFATWLAPLCVVVFAAITQGPERRLASGACVLHWLLLYAIGSHLVVYWFPDEFFYRSRWTITATIPAYTWLSLNALSICAAGAILLLRQRILFRLAKAAPGLIVTQARAEAGMETACVGAPPDRNDADMGQ